MQLMPETARLLGVQDGFDVGQNIDGGVRHLRGLRVLEQKINGHPALSSEEKLELQGCITRCYGSLTTLNVLFGNRVSSFIGQGERDE